MFSKEVVRTLRSGQQEVISKLEMTIKMRWSTRWLITRYDNKMMIDNVVKE